MSMSNTVTTSNFLLSIIAAYEHVSCFYLRSGPVQLLKMQIRTMTTPPTVSSCTWTWGTKCVCSWMGAKFMGETPTNTAHSPASSSTQTDSILSFIFSLSVMQQMVSSLLHLTCHASIMSFVISMLSSTQNVE